MLEIQVTVTAPELSAAVNRLADALAGQAKPIGAPAEPATAPSVAPVMPEGPAAAPVTVSAPVESPAAIPVAPATTAVPVAAPPAYTLDQIKNAGASLVDAGKCDQLVTMLRQKFGVESITYLHPSQYGALATELRALGAQI